MTHTCRECRHYEPTGIDPAWGWQVGKCTYARERFGGDVTVAWSRPTCKGFEKKEEKKR